MKQDYTMAYLRYACGLRESVPDAYAYGKTADQARSIQRGVDGLLARLRETTVTR